MNKLAEKKLQDSSPLFIEPFDLYLFGQGKHWDIYKILGAHPATQDGQDGFRFAVWAPNAQEAHLAGDFNDWQWARCALYPVGSSGIWAAFVPGFERGMRYKYGIKGKDGRIVYKSDPYAFHSELRPHTASVAWGLSDYGWNDEGWLAERQAQSPLKKPMAIYEAHPGAWRKKHDAEPPFFNFRELAHSLVPYVKDMGFTHIEFMGVSEHPLDLSWGYQVSGYYSPSSRFGTPEDFKYFVDQAHQNGIGIILDWVPAHFPKDDAGLGRFDGTALYEHFGRKLGEHPDWGTYVFNYARNEVRNFLLGNAIYWLREFHVDGLRVDAVASMLYRDYSRKEGEWVPNIYGGKENLEAISFLREMNSVVHGQFPGAMTIAEESTSWGGVSRPVYTGGLGFTFKWNMGWMHDMLSYMAQNPIHRSYHHGLLTFSMLYAFTENFILPLSHDEVVHGKKSLLSKMPGDMWQQQANLRLLYAYMWAHPGKKLLFMGSEFGQWTEWNESRELDWNLLDYPAHSGIRDLLRDLNKILRDEPAMHREDHSWQGFNWLDFSDHNASIISFCRKAEGEKTLVWVFNFTPVVRHNYSVPCPEGGLWRECLNTDSQYYGGGNVGNPLPLLAEKSEHPVNGNEYYINLTLPPLAGMAFVLEKQI